MNRKINAFLFGFLLTCTANGGTAEPPLLQDNKGKEISTKEAWLKRREELRELFRTHIYGRVPKTPFKLTSKVKKEDKKALDGRATLKILALTVTTEHGSLTYQVNLFVPNKRSTPAPAFILICNRGVENIDPTREKKSPFWPVEEIIDAGFATAAFKNSDVDPDDKKDDFKNGIHPLLDGGKRSDDSWGTIAAWAWGASRVLDYLETDPDVDATKVAVIGHSRGGKTALWAGANDERFAMAISNCSGCTGAALARRRVGEKVARINKSFPHWFCRNYRKFNEKEHELPVDQHMLIALMAPRAVCVASASKDSWADPVGEYLATRDAAPAWSLYGIDSKLPNDQPKANIPLRSGMLSYHMREGKHNLIVYDWEQYIAMGKKVFGM